MNRIDELLQERAGLIAEMRATIDKADNEKRSLTAEERQEQDKLEVRIGAIDSDVVDIRKVRELERTLEGGTPGLEGRELNGGGEETLEERSADYNKVFDLYLRHGAGELDLEQRKLLQAGFQQEQRDQTKGTNTAGGFLVPTGFRNQLLEHLVQNGTMRQTRATVLNTNSGIDLPVPKTTAHGSVAVIAETNAVTASDETFGQIVLKSWTYARLIKVSIQLLQDEGIDLEAYLGREFGRSMAAGQNAHYVNGLGSGSSQPQGVVGVASSGKVGAVGQTTSVTADDIIDLFYSVSPPYRRQGEWMLADSSVKAIRKLKDTTNQYLWSPGLTGNEPDQLLGKPLRDDPDMPVMAANAKSILFGDFSTYFIRDVNGISVRRLDERFADNLEVGFIAWMRSDGNLIDLTGSIKYYQNSAT